MFTLNVHVVEVASASERPIYTHQWQAVVSRDGKKVYESVGYHYALEARRAGEFWISRQRQGPV